VPPPGPSFAPKNYISAAQKPRRFNPWEVKPTTRQTSDPALRKDVNANSNSPVVKADQAISARRGSKRLPAYEVQASSPFQPPTDFSRRRENINSPVKETGSRTNRNRRSKANPASPTSPQKTQPPRRPQKPPFGPLVYIIRLLILGIGIGTIAGTLLSALNPTMPASVQRQDPAKTQQESPTPASPSATLQLTQEIGSLKAQIQALALQNPTLKPGVFIVDLDTGSYLDLDGGILFASASTIKLPILVAFFQDVDEGKIRLDEQLTLNTEMIADGSGDLQYKKVGTPFTTLELATKMMVISDNTATNMLIKRLGGMEALNQRFRSWGLTTTALRNRLPDVEGTNTTSPKELANLMSVVHRGNLVSLQSRDRLLNIMQRNEINNLLPQGLGTGAIIAHKTGNIGSLLADAGLVDLPTSKRYAIAVMVKRPFNDASAQELIRQISRKTYDYFNGTSTTPSTNPLPSKSPRTLSRAIASDTSIN
jgi:beta-lactamase class A